MDPVALQQIFSRLSSLESFRDSLKSVNQFDRDVETTIRQRLADLVKTQCIIGQGTFSGGHLDVTDPRINSKSNGIPGRLNSSALMTGRDDLAGGFLSG